MDDLELFYTVNSLQLHLNSESSIKKIGFVATMGALHHGHLSLIDKAFEICDKVVVSIFVNPKQFNNSGDLDNYPRTMEEDLKLLSTYSNLIVFAPSQEEVYPENYKLVELDLGILSEVMEGRFRPGHFDGVVNVVKRLFEIIKPDYAYFGLKDFQQLAVIEFMTNHFKMDVKIVGCTIYRQHSGLAYSSRNKRLSENDKKEALVIYESLAFSKNHIAQFSPEEIILNRIEAFKASSLQLEYLDIVNPVTLENLTKWEPGAHMCLAAFCGDVRLIDNMQLVPLD